jgi:hypothetical protein
MIYRLDVPGGHARRKAGHLQFSRLSAADCYLERKSGYGSSSFFCLVAASFSSKESVYPAYAYGHAIESQVMTLQASSLSLAYRLIIPVHEPYHQTHCQAGNVPLIRRVQPCTKEGRPVDRMIVVAHISNHQRRGKDPPHILTDPSLHSQRYLIKRQRSKSCNTIRSQCSLPSQLTRAS